MNAYAFKSRFDGYQCWIFDMDGTLTIPQHDFASIRQRLGIPVGEDILAHIDGRPKEDRSKPNKFCLSGNMSLRTPHNRIEMQRHFCKSQ